MNRLGPLLFVFVSVVIGVAYSEVAFSYTAGEADITVLSMSLIPVPFYVQKNVSDELTFQVTAQTSVLLCLQETIQLTRGISSCNKLGFFQFDINQTEQNSFSLKQLHGNYHGYGTGGAKLPKYAPFYDPRDVTISLKRELRLETEYWLSYQLLPQEGVNKSAFALEISTNKVCDSALNQWGPDCLPDTAYTYLTSGKDLPGNLPKTSSTKYYLLKVAAPAADSFLQNIEVNVTQDDCDPANDTNSQNVIFSYFRSGFPTDVTYDAVIEENNTCVWSFDILTPRPDLYIFGLQNNDIKPFAFTISNSQPPACDENTAGLNCLATITSLTDWYKNATSENNIFDSTKTKGGNDAIPFHYYSFADNNITIGIGGEKEGQTPNAYMDLGNIPSPSSNLLSNENETEPAHLLSAMTSAPAFFRSHFTHDANIWYIAVNATYDYTLWLAVNGTYCAANCTGQGACEEVTGICSCDDGYSKFDCSDKDFPLVWIILIAIGGAILLAIAIGVPVSCYVKNKKKSGYERV